MILQKTLLKNSRLIVKAFKTFKILEICKVNFKILALLM